MLLDAGLQRSLRPIKTLFSPSGIEGLVEQAVRVLRWGLWMAPIINSFLRQSPDPTWYNQDGAIRSAVVIGKDMTQSPAAFRQFSLTLFLGLLAYDWLRILIWFDHMGLRVATLVNLSFLGGDRADEAAARFVGHHGRTRAIPDGIRRFGTWAPLLIPFYIPRGSEWDKAWTGAETLARGAAPMPEAVKTLGFAYGAAIAATAAAGVAAVVRERAKSGPPAPWLDGAPPELARRPDRFAFNNGAVGVEIQRDGRGASFVMGAERGGGPIDLFRRPLDPLQARGQFFYVSEDGEEPWSIGFEPARRAGDYRIEEPGFNRLAIVNALNGIEARMEIAPDPEGAILSWRIRLENKSGRERRLRLVSFCEIAGHETGAYAKDLDFAGMHVETIFVRSLNAILARNRLLRSSRAGRGETSFFAVKPGLNAELVGYEDSRIRFIGEGSLLKPTGCEPWRWRKLDDEGKLWPFDPAASFTLEVTLAAGARAEAEFIVGRSDNAVWASELIATRLGLAPLPEAELEKRLYETRAVEPSPALPSRWPFSFSADGKALKPHPPHAPPVGACDGERARHGDDGLERRRDFLRLRQCAPERALRLPHGQRDCRAAGPDRLSARPRQGRDGRGRFRAVPARGCDIRRRLRAGRRDVHDVARRSRDRICRLRSAGLSGRHASFDPAQSRDESEASARRAVLRSRARRQPQREHRQDSSTRRSASTLLFQNPRNDFVRGFAFAATSLDATEDRDHPRPLLRRPGPQRPHPRDGRGGLKRRRRAR